MKSVLDWLTRTSTGQRLWFLAGVVLATALVISGAFMSGVSLIFLFAVYFIVLVSASYWIGHAQVPYEYWSPASNTPGNGVILVGRKDRFTDEFSRRFLAFLHGTGSLAFPSIFYSGWIWQQNEAYFGVFYNEPVNPFLSEMAYFSASSWFAVLLATWFLACFVHKDIPGVTAW